MGATVDGPPTPQGHVLMATKMWNPFKRRIGNSSGEQCRGFDFRYQTGDQLPPLFFFFFLATSFELPPPGGPRKAIAGR